MTARLPSIGVNEHNIEKITRSPYYLQHCANVTNLVSIAEQVIDIDFIGGFFGGQTHKDRCSPFACLLFRTLLIMGGSGVNSSSSSSSSSKESNSCHVLTLISEFISQRHHKYLRIFGIICLRLIIGGSAAETNLGGTVSPAALLVKVHKALDVGFLDYRRVRLMTPDGTVIVTTVDQVCDMLCSNNNNQNSNKEFLGLSMAMLPTRCQILELFPEEKKNLLTMST